MKKIVIFVLTTIGLLFSVYAAQTIKIDIDQDLESEIKALKGIDDANLSALVNDYLREQIQDEKGKLFEEQYFELGEHLSTTYDTGDQTEFDRIYNCVFP